MFWMMSLSAQYTSKKFHVKRKKDHDTAIFQYTQSKHLCGETSLWHTNITCVWQRAWYINFPWVVYTLCIISVLFSLLFFFNVWFIYFYFNTFYCNSTFLRMFCILSVNKRGKQHWIKVFFLFNLEISVCIVSGLTNVIFMKVRFKVKIYAHKNNLYAFNIYFYKLYYVTKNVD